MIAQFQGIQSAGFAASSWLCRWRSLKYSKAVTPRSYRNEVRPQLKALEYRCRGNSGFVGLLHLPESRSVPSGPPNPTGL